MRMLAYEPRRPHCLSPLAGATAATSSPTPTPTASPSADAGPDDRREGRDRRKAWQAARRQRTGKTLYLWAKDTDEKQPVLRPVRHVLAAVRHASEDRRGRWRDDR